MDWEELEKFCRTCTRCPLYSGRNNIVIGRGSKNAKLLFVGEGPGEQEDLQGKPFVGPAGQLLDEFLKACMFEDDSYYIANIVKCRPPSNRVPTKEEAETCLPFLRQQFKLINPKIVVCFGNTALTYVMEKGAKITKIRGQWVEKKGVYFLATYHPSALLRDPTKRIDTFQDLKKVKLMISQL
ncbi:MAG: uracil-DNA glycosylase [Clostridiales bacterium]|jgi:DNA polymerase|nr:uracil-DNA glycosylase [Clostridiales bacterium]